ncbi:MAG: DNA primase [Lachnospira sp.]|jgi:DNA primase|nr:DNA primase [Lachnospira sp.]MBS7061884.1 DNA primase [Eubacterium sp.]MEE0182777.1 DNA primase [Lachnospira sp.]HBD66924.1 DNA primase [Eubacterium sp.]
MPIYSSEVIEEVVSRNDIVDVISGYIKLKKSGSSYVGLCPFHNEKSPSFSVSGTKQMYHCFGCGVGGNVITFVMEYENYTFPEAVKMLADRAGIALPVMEYSGEDRRERDIKTKLLEINKIAATFYYHQLKSPAGQSGLDYLKKRQLSDKTINTFGLGYAPQLTGDLYRMLKEKGYDDELLKESGLFTYEKGIREKFWNRVIFPIMDINNKVIGFGGRVMGDGKPKYLNSPETKLFDKSKNLYGLNVARSSRKNNLIICEGYMDVISMHQAGFNQAVASLGTALTPGHARLMKRYTDNVLITYDSDEAGVKAALRAIPILKEAGLSTKVINMRPYKDPDEFIKALGTEAFQERIDKAENSFMYEIGIIEKNYNRSDPESETAFEREVANKLVQFSEKLERDNYMKAVCRQFMIPEDGMREMVIRIGSQGGIIPRQTQPVRRMEPARKKKEDGIRQAEKILLTWMIEDGDIYDKVSEYIQPDDFIDPLFKDVASKVYEQYETGSVNPAAIIGSYSDGDMHSEIAAMFSAELSESLSKSEREKTLNDTVLRVKKSSLDYKLEHAADAKTMQDIIGRQMKLNNIHISL